jgi:hypothetical protein
MRPHDRHRPISDLKPADFVELRTGARATAHADGEIRL